MKSLDYSIILSLLIVYKTTVWIVYDLDAGFSLGYRYGAYRSAARSSMCAPTAPR